MYIGFIIRLMLPEKESFELVLELGKKGTRSVEWIESAAFNFNF